MNLKKVFCSKKKTLKDKIELRGAKMVECGKNCTNITNSAEDGIVPRCLYFSKIDKYESDLENFGLVVVGENPGNASLIERKLYRSVDYRTLNSTEKYNVQLKEFEEVRKNEYYTGIEKLLIKIGLDGSPIIWTEIVHCQSQPELENNWDSNKTLMLAKLDGFLNNVPDSKSDLLSGGKEFNKNNLNLDYIELECGVKKQLNELIQFWKSLFTKEGIGTKKAFQILFAQEKLPKNWFVTDEKNIKAELHEKYEFLENLPLNEQEQRIEMINTFFEKLKIDFRDLKKRIEEATTDELKRNVLINYSNWFGKKFDKAELPYETYLNCAHEHLFEEINATPSKWPIIIMNSKANGIIRSKYFGKRKIIRLPHASGRKEQFDKILGDKATLDNLKHFIKANIATGSDNYFTTIKGL